MKIRLLILLLILLPMLAGAQTYSTELLQKAQSGDATAQCNLGYCYQWEKV